MLPLLSDLRKYIIDTKIINDGPASSFKQLLESSQDDILVDEILNGLVKRRCEIIDNEIYPFCNLINDYHLADTLDMLTENIVLQLMLSCLTDQYIIVNRSNNIFEEFLKLTERGRKISGYTSSKILADFIKVNWKDLEYEFNSMSDEEIKKAAQDDPYGLEIVEGYDFCSTVIVVDENDKKNDSIDFLLTKLGFSEVVSGLYYYGCYGALGYDGVDISLDYDDVQNICGCICSGKYRNVDSFDGAIRAFNEVCEGADGYLYLLFKDKSSSREVLF